MKKLSLFEKICLLTGAILPLPAIADVAVLIHGYHSSAIAWETSGVSQILQENGWPRAGLYSTAGRSIQYLQHMQTVDSSADNRVYVVDLPSEAPVALQADLLSGVLNDIRLRYPEEAVTLIGHSAGAIVARTVLARGSAPGVDRLISIAGPNLGTERTIQALNATDVPWPFSYVADFFAGTDYHTIKRSRHLLVDLLPATPGTYLGWLNVQPHPELEYIAIVRGHNLAMSGDWMVPGMSQDLNNVVALSGRARVITVPAGHDLSPLDGVALANILNEE